ncbi:hypothetical protein [Solimonas marina]|uniref:Uncharacterized protein n=1 Tax=Solimonas marina TaxID=2714601 RepID=A0A969W979_9GAMM|nr:hypothetical protein [Solimonas marina]NKF22967.1 hypothetical protein [Solimonas marina]
MSSYLSPVLIATVLMPFADADDPDAVGNDTAELIVQWGRARQHFQGTPKGRDIEQLWARRVELRDQWRAGRIARHAAAESFAEERRRILSKWAAEFAAEAAH